MGHGAVAMQRMHKFVVHFVGNAMEVLYWQGSSEKADAPYGVPGDGCCQNTGR